MNAPGQAPVGFAKHPQYPFAPSMTTSGVTVVANREGPFYEFSNISQFTDIDNNGINEWKDALSGQTNPYLYFSSYEGRGYDISELAVSNGSFVFLHDFYRVSASSLPALLPPSAPNFVNGKLVPAGSQTLPAQKPQTFQIISPGYDTNYGIGGVVNPNLLYSGLVFSYSNTNPPVPTPDVAAFDNLTNFNGGRLNAK